MSSDLSPEFCVCVGKESLIAASRYRGRVFVMAVVYMLTSCLRAITLHFFSLSWLVHCASNQIVIHVMSE